MQDLLVLTEKSKGFSTEIDISTRKKICIPQVRRAFEIFKRFLQHFLQ